MDTVKVVVAVGLGFLLGTLLSYVYRIVREEYLMRRDQRMVYEVQHHIELLAAKQARARARMEGNS